MAGAETCPRAFNIKTRFVTQQVIYILNTIALNEAGIDHADLADDIGERSWCFAGNYNNGIQYHRFRSGIIAIVSGCG